MCCWANIFPLMFHWANSEVCTLWPFPNRCSYTTGVFIFYDLGCLAQRPSSRTIPLADLFQLDSAGGPQIRTKCHVAAQPRKAQRGATVCLFRWGEWLIKLCLCHKNPSWTPDRCSNQQSMLGKQPVSCLRKLCISSGDKAPVWSVTSANGSPEMMAAEGPCDSSRC